MHRLKNVIFGETKATLYNDNCVEIGTCLDTPNVVAYAMASDERIMYSMGLLGAATRAGLKSRFKQSLKDAHIHSRYVWMHND